MTRFATGKYALGICDRCGLTFKLNSLRAETYKGVLLKNRVCSDCYDPDHPQLFIDTVDTTDGMALRDPRPDTAAAQSREIPET